MNPKDFKNFDFIQSKYSGKIYEVIESDKSGMSKLKNTETGGIEKWNSCNNPHFFKCEHQLQFNF